MRENRGWTPFKVHNKLYVMQGEILRSREEERGREKEKNGDLNSMVVHFFNAEFKFLHCTVRRVQVVQVNWHVA